LKIQIFALSFLFFASCRLIGGGSGDALQQGAETSALVTSMESKKLYLWNRRVKGNDNIWRSCWYYKEALAREGLSEIEAMVQSVPLNSYALHDDHVSTYLGDIIRERLTSSGVKFIPCGASAISLTAAIVAAAPTSGLSAFVLPASAVATAVSCVGMVEEVSRHTKAWIGAKDGITSLQNGETGMGKKSHASKSELDMFREAINRAIQKGKEASQECARPITFRFEILKNGMGSEM
jgi:hypothetical protein